MGTQKICRRRYYPRAHSWESNLGGLFGLFGVRSLFPILIITADFAFEALLQDQKVLSHSAALLAEAHYLHLIFTSSLSRFDPPQPPLRNYGKIQVETIIGKFIKFPVIF